jgi:CRP-like cAMP-binding protein
LCNLVASQGLVLEVTQQQVADFVGFSRVTVGQVLSQFAKADVIALGYGKITVKDRDALAAQVN